MDAKRCTSHMLRYKHLFLQSPNIVKSRVPHSSFSSLLLYYCRVGAQPQRACLSGRRKDGDVALPAGARARCYVIYVSVIEVRDCSRFLPWAPPWSTDAKFVLVLGTPFCSLEIWFLVAILVTLYHSVNGIIRIFGTCHFKKLNPGRKKHVG